jgi:hypothetical protein
MDQTPEDRTGSKPSPDAPEGASARRPRRRGTMWWLGWGFGGLSLLLFLLVGGLWLRLNVAPMTLPAALHDRIEARLDAAMVQGRLDIGDMALDLPEGGRAPVVEFRDVRLFDPDGAPRAAFPALRVQLEAGPILSGQVRPKRVEIAGAGLRLSRDAGGRFDLDLSGAEETATVTLPETMARLDAMFAAPAFDALQEVTATGLQLSMADAMTGQTMRIQDATARLTRRAGQLTLTVGGALEGSRNSRMDIAILRRAAEVETEIAAVFRDLAARDLATVSPALAWLDLARAPISGRLALQLGDDGTVGDLEARLDIGQGRVWLGQDSAPLGFDRIGADMLYDPDTRRLTFSALRLDAAELRFAAEGYADVAADGGSFVSQFRLSGIEAEPEGLFDAPRAIEGATVDMRLTLRPRLRIELGQATVFDGDLRVHAEGRVEATGEGLAVALDATLPEADLATVLSYWPEAAIPETRRWVSEQMDEATVQGVDFAWRSGPGEAPVQALQMSLSDMVMRPLRAGPPIRDASGVLELMGRRLVVRLDAGTLAGAGGGPVDMAGTTMVVEETGTPGPEADFRIAGQGRLSDILTLLGGPPFDIFREGTLTPDRIGDGQVTLRTTFRSRLEERDTPATLAELGLAAEAVVTGFASDTLVPGRELRADRLSVALSPDRLSVSGPASLSGVPVTGTWTRPMGPEAERASVLEARAVIDRPGLSALGVVLPDWLMSGQGAAELRLDLTDGAPGRLRVDSDLDGLALSIPALGWRMGPGATGALEVEVLLGETPEVTVLNLAGPGLQMTGRASLREGGGLDRLTVERLRLGSWLDVAGALVGRGAGVSPAVEIDGGRLSLRDAPNLGGGGTPPATGPLPVTARLNRLELGPDLALTDLSGSFEAGAGLEGDFEARVNGQAEIAGILSRGRFGPDVQVLSSDGGAVLRSAGIFRTAHGGRMLLDLQSLEPPQSYAGTLRIEGPRLRDAPAMAELLNLISVVGLLEQLSGDGINLGTVDARFTLTPGRLTLTEGAAVGPSLGISMDGVYDTASRRFDMQGVVSPLYMVNGLVGALFAPRREGLFGFSYRLTGTAQQSNVSVNPLSILTPGIFREIFRRPPPELTETQTE